jgi:hypothetical protein
MLSRSELFNKFVDPRRNIFDECGFPETHQISAETYREFYDRDSVASRIVDILPDECWKSTPSIFENEDVDITTPFEEAWNELGKSLRSEESFYQDEEGNPVFEYLHRLDRVSGIGTFGVLLIGLNDGKELHEEADMSGNVEAEIIYLRAFDESNAEIVTYETDRENARYGHPVEYNLTFNDPKDQTQDATAVGLENINLKVHWTRVIHVADNLVNSEIFGQPRMLPVFNNLFTLRKLYGGSGEMYWRGAFPGLSFETHPQLGPDATLPDNANDVVEKYMTGLQRYLMFTGMSVKSLAPQVVDPTPQIKCQIEAVCIKYGIPIRIFVGSERGELASSQDAVAWNDRLRSRQSSHITPRIIVPFVDRLILLGVLPRPSGYSVTWPDLDALSEAEEADVALKRTEALAKYIQGDVRTIIEPLDYLTRFLKFTDDEAEAMIESVMELLRDENPDADTDKIHAGKEPVTEEEPEIPGPIKVREGEKLVTPPGSPFEGAN